jgi:H+-translocating NAD(P) transhydrogenase subunit alpha
MVPDVARRLTGAGHEVLVERGAGEQAAIPDEALEAAGATLADAGAVWGAEVVAKVARPDESESARLTGDSVLIGFLNPLGGGSSMTALAGTGATTFAMEAVPRISRAQSMDALSSQATVGGYLAVLIAAQEMPRFFPMLMTAAGTIPPAQVLVLGAGVAGLQAIALS